MLFDIKVSSKKPLVELYNIKVIDANKKAPYNKQIQIPFSKISAANKLLSSVAIVIQ